MLSATKPEGARASPAEPVRFDPVPGTVVADKYRVERTLGEGGMGLVVSATHLGLEQHVAIKFLLPQAMRNKEAVERFLREAKVAARVRSEYVARVHDVGSLDSGPPYIVMEHLEGQDLGQVLSEGGALPIGEACEIVLQACEALSEVHAAGIVHRDLKPSNLFITRRTDGSPAVKLLDFGISKLTSGADEATEDPALTATATIMGSPSYMSPEQLKSTKEVDHRSDVWSLGAVLYEALTAKPAFRGESVPQVCAMIASEDPVPPSRLREDIPQELEGAILGCLEKKPEQRFALVDLAGVLVRFVPERAKVSLERIEGTLGRSEPRVRGPASSVHRPDAESRRDELPVMPLATAPTRPARPTRADVTGGSVTGWRDEERPRRRGIGGPLTFLVLTAAGVVGIGVYTGRIDVGGLRGQLAGAGGAVTSAASAVTSAAGAVSSAVTSAVETGVVPPLLDPPSSSPPPASARASARPNEPPVPSASAAASADPDLEPDDEDLNDLPPIPSASASSQAPLVTSPPVVHPVQPKPHPVKPRHGTHRKRHI